MDTKWKKSKAVCGFLSFVLGVSLLLTSLLPTAGNLSNESGREHLTDALKHDFRETAAFRNYLCDTMNRFIVMGAGGSINAGYYGYYDYGGYDTIQEASVITQEGGYPEALFEDSSEPVLSTEAIREQWKKEAERYHQSIQKDLNILYIIQKDGKVLYTNLDSQNYDHANRPAGHNTILSFHKGKCIVQVNGQALPIYGENNDELYQEDGQHWYLPGYTNFPAGKETDGVAVYMAVADTPALYITPDYSSGDWSQWTYNRLYHLEKRWRENRQQLVICGAIQTGMGVLFLAVWFFLRKEKPLVDRAIAGGTGHTWFEFKILLLLASLALTLFPFSLDMRQQITEMTYALYTEDGGYYQLPWFLSSYLYEVLRRPGAVLPAFWICYLFVNDLRYGKKPWRHGLFGMLSARGLKLPIQKRLSRRSAVLAVVLLVLGGYIALFIPALNFNFISGLKFFLFPVSALLTGLLLAAGPKQQRLWSDIGLLTDQISAVHNGDLAATALPADSDLGKASQEVADIQQGMAQAVAEQTRSERMKVELVTNVSHDLKTPLTSIISYAELLKQENLGPPAGEYVEILCQKAERLRTMVLDVFEVSKAASGELPVKLEELDLAKLLRQTTADMAQAIDAAPVTLRQTLPEDPVTITADGDRLYRVFQNLLQNALTYALEGSRVYLSLEVRDGTAVASVKNTSKTEIPSGIDYTERFVRGDSSRTDGGSGLGLAIADTFTRACGGELTVAPIADLFVVSVTFPLSGRASE